MALGYQFWAKLTPTPGVSGANLGSDHVFLIVKIQVLGQRLHMDQPLVASHPGHV